MFLKKSPPLPSWLCWTPAGNISASTTCRAKFSWLLVLAEWAELKRKRPQSADASASLPRYIQSSCRAMWRKKKKNSVHLLSSVGQLRRAEKTLRSGMGPGDDWRCGSASGTRPDGPSQQRSICRFDDLTQVIDYQSTNELFIDDQHRIPRQRGRRLGADGPRVPGDGRVARGPRLGPNQLPRSLRRRLLPSRIVLSRVAGCNTITTLISVSLSAPLCRHQI